MRVLLGYPELKPILMELYGKNYFLTLVRDYLLIRRYQNNKLIFISWNIYTIYRTDPPLDQLTQQSGKYHLLIIDCLLEMKWV